MQEIFHVVIAGIAVVALTYVLVNNSSNAAKVASGATQAYGRVATTFQGK